jgi:hypothetical protein
MTAQHPETPFLRRLQTRLQDRGNHSLNPLAGLDPAIHVSFQGMPIWKDVDPRDKPGGGDYY